MFNLLFLNFLRKSVENQAFNGRDDGQDMLELDIHCVSKTFTLAIVL